MRKVIYPIGCVAFTIDYHKVKIVEIQKECLVGECCHGDFFKLPLDTTLYEEVEYDRGITEVKEEILVEDVPMKAFSWAEPIDPKTYNKELKEKVLEQIKEEVPKENLQMIGYSFAVKLPEGDLRIQPSFNKEIVEENSDPYDEESMATKPKIHIPLGFGIRPSEYTIKQEEERRKALEEKENNLYKGESMAKRIEENPSLATRQTSISGKPFSISNKINKKCEKKNESEINKPTTNYDRLLAAFEKNQMLSQVARIDKSHKLMKTQINWVLGGELLIIAILWLIFGILFPVPR